jgi:hypothetical protein
MGSTDACVRRKDVKLIFFPRRIQTESWSRDVLMVSSSSSSLARQAFVSLGLPQDF